MFSFFETIQWKSWTLERNQNSSSNPVWISNVRSKTSDSRVGSRESCFYNYVFISFAADDCFLKIFVDFSNFSVSDNSFHFIHRFIIFVSWICLVHTFAKIWELVLIIFELSWWKYNFYFFADRSTHLFDKLGP